MNFEFENLVGKNLSDSFLGGVNLNGFDLHEINLSGSDLSGASIKRGILFNAKLRGADMRQVDLSEAKILDAEMYGTNLESANLSGADIFNTDLKSSNLSNADLSGAFLKNNSFEETNLENTIFSDTKYDILLRYQDWIATRIEQERMIAGLKSANVDDALIQSINAEVTRSNFDNNDMYLRKLRELNDYKANFKSTGYSSRQTVHNLCCKYVGPKLQRRI